MSVLPTEVVVIGYGNELRGDDGIGPYFAAVIAGRAWPHVQTLAVQQLTPELAEVIAAVRLAVFVDAHANPDAEPVQVRLLEPVGSLLPEGHIGDPRTLLGLTRELYGAAPLAWLVTVAGRDFNLGERLSSEALANSCAALERLEDLLKTASRARNGSPEP